MRKRILEILIAVPAVTGSFLVASLSKEFQLLGFSLWLVANTCGTVFMVKRKYWFLLVQYLFFLVSAFIGLLKRL